MSDLEKYQEVFVETFSVDVIDLNQDFAYQSIVAWDSIGHMSLITALENAFDILIEMDDVIDFASFDRGREILRKYEIDL
jgi:acyl carrier protein